ncbi:MAG: DinB family protein [Vicinamibacterales bacterium]
MLATLRDLVAHHGHANAMLLAAIGSDSGAAADPEILDLLHHVLLANRFWLVTVLGQPFDQPHESRPAASLDALVERYGATHDEQSAWLAGATEADLDRVLVSPLIPGGQCTVAQAVLQVCLHGHGHRAQIAKLLRRHGTVPPQTDFIVWLTHRSAAASSSS